LANVTIDDGTTSAAGSASDGVLGCYNSTGEITILQGWNWYDGADATQIGSNHYDFQTVMTHELGHALSLGGSTGTSSPMNEVLAAGVARRTPAAADLNIPAEPDGADAERAALPAASASTAHSLAPAIRFDPSLATALAYSSSTNSDTRTTLMPNQDSAPAVPQLLAALPAGNASAPRNESEKLPESKPVSTVEDGAANSDVPSAAPAGNPEKAPSAPSLNPDAPADNQVPAVHDSALLSRVYDDAGMDGCWASAFAGTDSPLLAQSDVDTGVTDAPAALAIILGGFWLAPAMARDKKREWEEKTKMAPGLVPQW
jgi:hypothetical protein